MRLILLLILLFFSTTGISQNYKFDNADNYSKRIMNYQEKPEPEKLYSAFKFGVKSKKISKAGSRRLVVAFFGSIFRADFSIMTQFYKQVKQEN